MDRVFFGHIQLKGSLAYIAKTQSALVCLQTADLAAVVWNLVSQLREARRTGVFPYMDLAVIDVGGRTWNSTTIWYAGAIAHEGFHVKLYREAKVRNGKRDPKGNTWTGVEAEKKCLEFQLRVLQELRAEDGVLDYVREGMKSPTYQGDPFSRKDFLMRNW